VCQKFEIMKKLFPFNFFGMDLDRSILLFKFLI
jgi:hypothetical protein